MALHIPGFISEDSATHRSNSFPFMGWEFVHVEGQLCTLFHAIYMMDCGFSCHRGSLTQSPMDTKGQLKFWGSQIKYRFLTVQVVNTTKPLNPGSTVFMPCHLNMSEDACIFVP